MVTDWGSRSPSGAEPVTAEDEADSARGDEPLVRMGSLVADQLSATLDHCSRLFVEADTEEDRSQKVHDACAHVQRVLNYHARVRYAGADTSARTRVRGEARYLPTGSAARVVLLMQVFKRRPHPQHHTAHHISTRHGKRHGRMRSSCNASGSRWHRRLSRIMWPRVGRRYDWSGKRAHDGGKLKRTNQQG